MDMKDLNHLGQEPLAPTVCCLPNDNLRDMSIGPQSVFGFPASSLWEGWQTTQL